MSEAKPVAIITQKKWSRLRRFGLLLLLVVIVGGLYQWWWGGGEEGNSGTTYVVHRGPMEISVLEGGSIEAQESQAIACEVQGQTKILTIVEEGYLITPEDVATGKILVELDSKTLLDKQTEQELQYQNALAAFTESREQHGIQINQNESDIKAAELQAKFALMDFEKYLGQEVAEALLEQIGLDDIMSQMQAALLETPAPVVEGLALADPDSPTPLPEAEADADVPEQMLISHESLDFSSYADPDKLGDGEARQRLRKLDNDLVLAMEDLSLAQSDLEGTQRLYEKDFVTKNEMENDQMSFKRKQVSLDASKTSKALFIKYEFPKMAEKLLSDYEEALRKLLRAHKLAASKLAQSTAKKNSAEARYLLQTRKRDEIAEQLEKCVIRAEHPGLVVYGTGDSRYYRNNAQIEEGASVRERQVIITIPDNTRMAVKVQVHESVVKRVKVGQRARVRVDSNPDKLLMGEVAKIAVLPDSQNRWMNPDLKVYSTTLHIEGNHDWLKPGMSAESEIIIQQLEDVVQAPLQAISTSAEGKVVFISKLGGAEKRLVETGVFNESFIEIRQGLEGGERLLLRNPAYQSTEETESAEGGSAQEAPKKEQQGKKGGGRKKEKKAGKDD